MKSLNQTRREIAQRKESAKCLLAQQKADIASHKLLAMSAAKRAIAACPIPNLTELTPDIDEWIRGVRPDPAPEPPTLAPTIEWAEAEVATASDQCKTPLLGFIAWATRQQSILDKRRLCVPLAYVEACGEKLVRYRHDRFPLDLEGTLAAWRATPKINSLTEIRQLDARAT